MDFDLFLSRFLFVVAICYTSMLLLNFIRLVLVVFTFHMHTAWHCHWYHAIDNYALVIMFHKFTWAPPIFHIAYEAYKFIIDLSECQFWQWVRDQNAKKKINNKRKVKVTKGCTNERYAQLKYLARI